MGLSVNLVLSTERLRDGGSLAVIFQGNDACEYMLYFPVKRMGSEPVDYNSPILVNRTTGIELDIGLDNAAVFLEQLKACAENIKQREFIENMRRLC